MNIIPALVIIVIIAVTGFLLWIRIDGLRCVTCGQVHLAESEIHRCKECGKPFCRDNVAHGERNSVLSQGRFSSAFASSSSSISYGGDKCGIVYEVISNGKRMPNIYLCIQHADE